MSRVLGARIFKGYSIIIFQIFWKDSYARNTRSEGVQIIKNVKFDLIKILESPEVLFLEFLDHKYSEDLALLSLKNVGGILMAGTPLPKRLKICKM